MKRVFAFTALAIAALACGDTASPRAQWVIAIGTDAPLPAFGDRIRVEITDSSGAACDVCTRDFAADDPSQFPLSFGALQSDDYTRIRVRLFRVEEVDSADNLDPHSTIDVLALLPGAPTGVTSLSVALNMSCMGVASDLANGLTCDPESGALVPITALANGGVPKPGSWAPGADVPCNGDPPSKMICVPGGAFMMGDDTPALADEGSSPEHLVQLSPYALDQDEMTVGTFRALVKKTPSITERPQMKDPNTLDLGNVCSYVGDDDASGDAEPLNCVSRDLASAVCAALGKALPSEAQIEFAARNRGARTVFPWGNDANACAYAIVGRARDPIELPNLTTLEGDSSCREQLDGTYLPWGPQPGGSPRDVTTLGLLNLGGNLTEWVQDDFVAYTDPCWTASTLLVDPVCTGSGTADARGGSYLDYPALARVPVRSGITNDGPNDAIGVRCAKPM